MVRIRDPLGAWRAFEKGHRLPRRWIIGGGAGIALLLSGMSGAHAGTGARRCTLDAPPRAAPARVVTADDLLKLRDFGGPTLDGDPFELSADGHWAALALRQGDPDSNSYCTGLVVVPLSGRPGARIIDNTGLVERMGFDIYGMTGIPLGVPKPVKLSWQPSGDFLAYTKTITGRSEIWISSPDGSAPRHLTTSETDIESLAWSRDGASVIYTSRATIRNAILAQGKEGRSGFRYDDRFWPLGSSRPYLAGPYPLQSFSVALATGIVSEEATDEAARPMDDLHARTGVKALASFGEDRRAWASPDNPDAFSQPARLHLRVSGGDVPCSQPVCTDVQGLWWVDDGSRLIYTRREGPARSRTGIYSWRLGDASPRPILVTDDALFGCKQSAGSLVCARETSTRPRHVIRVDFRGRVSTLFDPNPGYSQVRSGPVRRLQWSNRFGIKTFGDLVLPPGYEPGRRLPLVVVQYESRGFLRGGTADEYPIQLFAAQGFAVLSFNRPPAYALQKGDKTADEFFRVNQTDWADRWNIQSSLEVIITKLVAEGIVDAKRIGVTGQSDGASTATFALIHSDLFKAAALSTCCEDETMMATLGEGFQKRYVAMGYPAPGTSAPAFWQESSLLLNSAHAPVPILIQAGSEEFRMALPTFETLKNRGWPIEMYVFPEEGHVKIQPAHRRAVYSRTVEWMLRTLGGSGPRSDH